MTARRIISFLSAADFVTIVFLLLLSVLNLLFASRIEMWHQLVLANTAVIGLIGLFARRAESTRSKLWTGIHRWYVYPIILFVYKELYLMVRPIHPIDYDTLLIAIDHWMIGVNPTQWMAQFIHPFITEILQIAYTSYYLLFVLLGVEMYRRNPVQEFDTAAFYIVYGFYLSYLGYFLLPAVGPRFTLHEFSLLDMDMPGLLLTKAFRDFVNFAESVPVGVENPVAVVQRDVFPSGHTQLSLVMVYLAFRYHLQTRWLFVVLVTLLIIGTVYLRYHYVIDLIAGAFFFLLTIWSGRRIRKWWHDVVVKAGEES